MVRRINRAGGIRLSDGTHLPQGTFIGTSGEGVLRDPDIVPDADRFDGLRYFKLRQQPDHATKHQLVSLGEYDTQFGTGVQACLGRWLVGYEIKLLVAWLLLFCDLEVEADSKEDISALSIKLNAKIRVRRKGGR